EALLREVAVPVRGVAYEHGLVEGARFGEAACALGVARGPVAGLAAVVRVAPGVSGEVPDEEARRLREVLRVVRGPGHVELRAGDFRVAGEELDGEAVEVERVRLALRVPRRLARGDEGAHRPLALGEDAAHLFERRARGVPLACARVVLREVVERF